MGIYQLTPEVHSVASITIQLQLQNIMRFQIFISCRCRIGRFVYPRLPTGYDSASWWNRDI